MNPLVLRKLARKASWERILKERLAEPLHLNIMSGFAWLFGAFETKVAWDLVVRQHNAYCLLKAAQSAKLIGLDAVTAIEFGVAAGAGLLNMAKIGADVTRATGVVVRIYGFDTGAGMPPPVDGRDHPDLYQQFDFPMDAEKLRPALPSNVELLVGDVAAAVPSFLQGVSADAPVGYVVFDLDYYSSTMHALRLFDDPDPRKYLPIVQCYFDDIAHERHNSWCGELLAIAEFNAGHTLRKLERHAFLEATRIMRRASWIKHVCQMHALDHPRRTSPSGKPVRVLENPYLSA